VNNFRNTFVNLLRDDSGQDLIEYALVAALIGLGATVAMQGLSTTLGTAMTSIGTKVTTAVTPGP
jgi:pilus assembly protein Flp/PilA